jgi:hypothetical protein
MEEKKASLPVIVEQYEPLTKPEEKVSKNKKKLKINILGLNDSGLREKCSHL